MRFITKLHLSMIFLVLGISLLFLLFVVYNAKKMALTTLTVRGNTIVYDLITETELGVLANDVRFIKESIEHEYGQKNIAYILVYDKNEKLLFKKSMLSFNIPAPKHSLSKLTANVVKNEIVTFRDMEIYEFLSPITTAGIDDERVEDCMFRYDIASLETLSRGKKKISKKKKQNQIIGYIRVGFSTHQVKNDINKIIRLTLFISSLFIFLGVIISYILAKSINRPLYNLTKGVRAIRDGNLNQNIDLQTQDEFAELARSFNEMRHTLKERLTALKEANSDKEILNVELQKNMGLLSDQAYNLKAVNNELLRITKALESSSDAVAISDRHGNHFYQNKAFSELFGYELAELNSKEISAMLYADKGIASEIFEMNMNGHAWNGEVEMVCRDNRNIPVLLCANAVKNQSGKIIGHIGIHKDITEQKRTEKELEHLNKQLVETAHQAGKAELATDVLHNVGNILNSVNITTELLKQKIHKSITTSLPQIMDIINQHSDTLGEFITSTPKGRMLPKYFNELSKGTESERRSMEECITILTKHITHIKTIVNMQQSYARMAGFVVWTSLSESIDDALKITGSALFRHKVEIEKNYADIAPVLLDSQKFLQVLVNLFSNAKYAIIDFREMDKKIFVRLYKPDNEHIRIEVKDNGGGISRDNLTKIFNHGFTTKKHGHGFGLHFSANAATQMGGSLTAQSDGLGKGATFTLELPLDLEKQTNEQ